MRTPDQQSYIDEFFACDREVQESVLIDHVKRESAAVALLTQLTGLGQEYVLDLLEVACQRHEDN